MFDRTTAGSSLKWLSIVDNHTRERLALKVDRGITAEAVIDTLAELFSMRRWTSSCHYLHAGWYRNLMLIT